MKSNFTVFLYKTENLIRVIKNKRQDAEYDESRSVEEVLLNGSVKMQSISL